MMEVLISKFDSLKSWVNQNGGYVNDKLSLVPTGDSGLSIVCNTNIEDENLLLVSDRLILCPKNSDLNIDLNGMDYKNILALVLLHEIRKQNSFFDKYFELLPGLDRYQNHPIYLFAENKFPRFSEKIYLKTQEIFQKFSNLYSFCKNSNVDFLQNLTYEEVLWAFLTVLTRCSGTVGLIPIADFFQHSSDSNSHLEYNADHTKLRLNGRYSIGEIVYINYDMSDDIDIFVNYGFIDKSEICSLKIDFKFNERSEVMNYIIKGAKVDFEPFISSFGINNDMLFYLRINMMSESDLILMNKESGFYKNIISIDNERKCLQKLKLRLSVINSKEELDYVNVNLSNLTDGTIEYNICHLILKINRMIESINNSIDSYWKSLLDQNSRVGL